jgi:hypothetical protein
MALVGLVKDLVPERCSDNQIHYGEFFQLPSNRAGTRVKVACDLPHVKRLIGPPIQQCQNSAADLPKQDIR